MLDDEAGGPWGIALFERVIAQDHQQVVANQARVRALALNGGDVRVFSAHDAVEFERLRS